MLAAITLALAVLAALIALPLHQRRERRMIETAHGQMRAVIAAVEEFRGHHYRLPDSLDELEASGYSTPAFIVICGFRRVPDRRRFDDHIRIVLRHRASGTAVVTRYPAAGEEFIEAPASESCDTDPPTVATREEGR